MKKYLFIIIANCFLTSISAQNCIDFNLSKIFDFESLLISKDQKDLGKAKIIINIFDKRKALKTQTISFESEFILKSESFKQCENNKSYMADTYLNSNENDFGDLIVADFNFDGLEDIAIKREEGGNGGPLYNFYIQSKDQQFLLDEYLSNEMSFFPDYIDSKEKTLHVYIRVNSSKKEGITYKYNQASKTWKIEKSRKHRN